MCSGWEAACWPQGMAQGGTASDTGRRFEVDCDDMGGTDGALSMTVRVGPRRQGRRGLV